MSSQPHLQIFRGSQPAGDEESNFSHFGLLPKEIRLKIWRHSLQRQRIIKIHLKPQTNHTGNQEAESTGSASNKERYCAVVKGYQLLSKLFRVSGEAREVALKFYRVQLPCMLTRGAWGQETTKPGTFYFNPEYDFLQISPKSPAKDTLVDFIYHLKTTYDPRGIGLLNVAFTLNGLNAHDLYELQPSDIELKVKIGFIETLTQLREVFFVCVERAGRQILGPMSGIPTSETLYNRSLPINANSPAFERLQQDPRAIAQDLKSVFSGTSDPRIWSASGNNCSRNGAFLHPKSSIGFSLPSGQSVKRMLSTIAKAQSDGCRKKTMIGRGRVGSPP